jgi:HSP20 family protein
MPLDIVPSNFWRLPIIPSVLEDITDVDNWLPALPTYGALSGLLISEDDKNVYVEAAVLGVDPKDVDVIFHKGMLCIKGQAKGEEKKKKYYRKATSSFSYRIAIPEDVDGKTEPQAECSKGVVKVTFAKFSKTQPKKIALKAVGEGEMERKNKRTLIGSVLKQGLLVKRRDN